MPSKRIARPNCRKWLPVVSAQAYELQEKMFCVHVRYSSGKSVLSTDWRLYPGLGAKQSPEAAGLRGIVLADDTGLRPVTLCKSGPNFDVSDIALWHTVIKKDRSAICLAPLPRLLHGSTLSADAL